MRLRFALAGEPETKKREKRARGKREGARVAERTETVGPERDERIVARAAGRRGVRVRF